MRYQNPYRSVQDAIALHPNLKKYSRKARSAWVKAFNSCWRSSDGGDEGKCFRIAYAAANRVDGVGSIRELNDNRFWIRNNRNLRGEVVYWLEQQISSFDQYHSDDKVEVPQGTNPYRSNLIVPVWSILFNLSDLIRRIDSVLSTLTFNITLDSRLYPTSPRMDNDIIVQYIERTIKKDLPLNFCAYVRNNNKVVKFPLVTYLNYCPGNYAYDTYRDMRNMDFEEFKKLVNVLSQQYISYDIFDETSKKVREEWQKWQGETEEELFGFTGRKSNPLSFVGVVNRFEQWPYFAGSDILVFIGQRADVVLYDRGESFYSLTVLLKDDEREQIVLHCSLMEYLKKGDDYLIEQFRYENIY